MNILVFGKDGQLGKAFKRTLDSAPFCLGAHRIQYVGRLECDLSAPAHIEKLLVDFQPQLIINASAYTAVDKAEQEPDVAFAINATAPEVMARYAANQGVTFLPIPRITYLMAAALISMRRASQSIHWVPTEKVKLLGSWPLQRLSRSQASQAHAMRFFEQVGSMGMAATLFARSCV